MKGFIYYLFNPESDRRDYSRGQKAGMLRAEGKILSVKAYKLL
jgi:hypothetical protein